MAKIKQGLRPNTVSVENLVYINSETTEMTEASGVHSIEAKSFQTENHELTDDLLGRLSNLDFQPDILKEQLDATLVPSLVDGARYILSNASTKHASFGTINKLFDGSAATLGNGDIVQYVAASSEFRIDYDVSARGPGALVWDRDYANFKKWDGTVWSAATSGDLAAAKLGLPPDGSYDDGLFAFDAETTPAKAVDDINEALKYLAPAQGYTLNSMGSYTGLPTLFGSGHKITGSTSAPLSGSYYENTDTNGGTRTDIISGGGFTLTTPQTLNKDGVTLDVGFQKADQGILVLELNGSTIGTLDLGALFVENNRAAGQTITGSHTAVNGKLKVTSVAPTNGFPLWQDGTAQIILATGDLLPGYNVVYLKHTVDGVTKTSPARKFWYAPVMTAPAASGLTLGPISSKTTKYLSGVLHVSGGTYAAVAASVDNPYGRTFRDIGCVLSSSYLSSVNVTTPNPTISGGVVTNIPWSITAQSMAIQTSKRVVLGQQLTASATPKDNYNSNGTVANAAVSNILLDTYAVDASYALTHAMASETNRVKSDTNFNDTTVVANWDSSQSIADGGAAGYNDGLQVYNGALRYPSGNFTTITEPQAGPDYSGCLGRRKYIGIFRDTTQNRNNFKLTLNGISASLLGPTTDSSKIQVEMALPTQTKDGSGNFEWKDCMQAYTTDAGKGCQNGAAPSGSNPTILFTAGTKGTANSDYKVLIRISYPAGSSAAITSITFSFTQP